MLFYEKLPETCFFPKTDILRFNEHTKDVLNARCDFLSETAIFYYNGYYCLNLDTFIEQKETEIICNLVLLNLS